MHLILGLDIETAVCWGSLLRKTSVCSHIFNVMTADGLATPGHQQAWYWPREFYIAYLERVCTVFPIDDKVQDCSNSSALAMEFLQSCIKPSIYAKSGEEKLYLHFPFICWAFSSGNTNIILKNFHNSWLSVLMHCISVIWVKDLLFICFVFCLFVHTRGCLFLCHHYITWAHAGCCVLSRSLEMSENWGKYFIYSTSSCWLSLTHGGMVTQLCRRTGSSLVQIMARCPLGAEPLSESMMIHWFNWTTTTKFQRILIKI